MDQAHKAEGDGYRPASLKRSQRLSHHLTFADDEMDDLSLEKKTFDRCQFDNLGLKKATLKECAITHSAVSNCYMREAVFERVDFSGTRFVNCNLEKAEFRVCTFDYVTFTGCKLNVAEILGSLPDPPNLKRRVLREIRRNEEAMGERSTADQLLLKEIQAQRSELWEVLCRRTTYYRKRAERDGWCRTLWRLAVMTLNDMFWGHGLNLLRLLTAGLVATAGFALLIHFCGLRYVTAGSAPFRLGFIDSLYLSTVSFATAGYAGFMPFSLSAKIVFTLESVAGLLFLGFVAASLYRRIAK